MKLKNDHKHMYVSKILFGVFSKHFTVAVSYQGIEIQQNKTL